ncbi:MAG: hypothetical protein HFE76_00665 [Firmicutes bacterium]|nr:hypothetical protein [Bacillota bacterium]
MSVKSFGHSKIDHYTPFFIKTTYEERVEIVKYCIEHEMDYAQTAENILNREFYAGHFGEKWLTDVTELRQLHRIL